MNHITLQNSKSNEPFNGFELGQCFENYFKQKQQNIL